MLCDTINIMTYNKFPKIKRRSIISVVLLSLITFGIYYFVWLYNIFKEGRLFTENTELPSEKKLLAYLLIPIVNIAGIILFIFVWNPKFLNACEEKANLDHTNHWLIVVMGLLVPFFIIFMQYKLNKVSETCDESFAGENQIFEIITSIIVMSGISTMGLVWFVFYFGIL